MPRFASRPYVLSAFLTFSSFAQAELLEKKPVPASVLVAANSASGTESEQLSLKAGKVEFHAPTSLKALAVHGESTQVSGSVSVTRLANEIRLSKMRVQVPVESLATGMSVRDSHMRDKIFKDAKGALPALVFEAADVLCAVQKNASDCQVEGQLTIRGVAKPFSLPVRITLNENQSAKAKGSATLSLKEYGIEAPTQFGVTVSDEIALTVELEASQSPSTVTSR